MAAIMKMRVRLDFTEYFSNNNDQSPMHSFYWFFLDTSNVSNVVQFKNEVTNRYKSLLKNSDFTLFIDNAAIHDYEAINVLRDGDTVKLVPQSACKSDGSFKKHQKKCKVSVEPIEPESIAVVFSNTTNGTSKCKSSDLSDADCGDSGKKHKRKKRKHHHKNKKEQILDNRNLSSSNVTSPNQVVQVVETPNIEVAEKSVEKEDDTQSVEYVGEDNFQEGISEPKKKRKRGRRKRKTNMPALNNSFESPPIIDIDCPPSSAIEPYQDIIDASSSKTHIRFDGESNKNSPKKVFGQGFMKFDNGFKEMSKERQINSTLVNKSVILLNCDNTEPNLFHGIKNESNPSTSQVRLNTDTPKFILSSRRDENEFPGDDTLDNSELSMRNESFEYRVEENAPNCSNKLSVRLRTPILRFNAEKAGNSNSEPVESLLVDQQTAWTRSRAPSQEANNYSSPMKFGDQADNSKTEPEKDRKNWTALVGPPRIGDLIAYKVLELGENYCPEVSKYKTAKVVGYQVKDDMIELENLSEAKRKFYYGKFDLVNEEESETHPSADKFVSIKLNDLIEPKLINASQ